MVSPQLVTPTDQSGVLILPFLPPLYGRITAGLSALLQGVSTEEISRQHKLLAAGAGRRAVLTALTYAMGAMFVPLPYVIGLAVLDYTAERYGLICLYKLEPAKAPLRYVASLLAIFASQLALSSMLALSYQHPAPLAAAFAAGTMTLTMLQMASIRVVHLPYAAVGLGTCFLLSVVAVTINWQTRSGPEGLFLSYLALAAAAYFIFAIVIANHDLHDGIARERDAAKAADRAKSRFLTQMSHELRTPLNAILGLGHAELAQARTPDSVERLRLVTDAARGLAVILDDILDMAAVEAGRLPVRPVVCNLASELTAVAALYRPLCHGQGLEFSLTLAPDLPAQAMLDTQRLRQCLSNLFSNALKHTTRGSVRMEARLDEGGHLAVTVSDSGTGISADMIDRLFEPFQRGVGDVPGNGLGLSISRSLARAMGGDLVLQRGKADADSPGKPDGGAQFLLTLALGEVVDAPQVLAHDPAPVAALTKGRVVLVVDDIATNRLVARAHLALYGLTVTEAASGAAAVEMIRASAPDMVLLDMNMPGMDGLATLRQIRALPSRAAKLPVVAMTADATTGHRRTYLEAGLDGYLAKPLTPEAVAEVLSKHLQA